MGTSMDQTTIQSSASMSVWLHSHGTTAAMREGYIAELQARGLITVATLFGKRKVLAVS